jgi:hypothetical protein
MKIVNFKEVKPMLVAKMTGQLLFEAFKLMRLSYNIAWLSKPSLDENCISYALAQGWDPNTTLVLYGDPPDHDPEKEISPEMLAEEMGGLTLLNHSQCICMCFPNMTLEDFIRQINQIAKMKAFL